MTRLRLHLSSPDHREIDRTAMKIVTIALRDGSRVAGPIPFANKQLYTDVGAIRIHRLRIDIEEPTPDTMASLTGLNISERCQVRVEV